MILDPLQKLVKIPVKIVQGKVVSLDGSALPELKDATGELLVPAYSVKDPAVLVKLTEEKTLPVLPEGSILLAEMRVYESHSLGNEKRDYLRSVREKHQKQFPMGSVSAGSYFAEITLREPLRLRLRGTKEAILENCPCNLGYLKTTVHSINEAYFNLSTDFEPHRRSHNGNVFQKVFFKDNDGLWHPLNDLRKHHQVQQEKLKE